MAWDLGPGEGAVLSWALRHQRWTALLDDGAARRAAKALGIRISGTLGVVLAAKAKGLVAAVGPVLDELVRAGLRADDALLEEVLQQAGER